MSPVSKVPCYQSAGYNVHVEAESLTG